MHFFRSVIYAQNGPKRPESGLMAQMNFNLQHRVLCRCSRHLEAELAFLALEGSRYDTCRPEPGKPERLISVWCSRRTASSRSSLVKNANAPFVEHTRLDNGSSSRDRIHDNICLLHSSLILSLGGQDTWFSPKRLGFESRMRNFFFFWFRLQYFQENFTELFQA